MVKSMNIKLNMRKKFLIGLGISILFNFICLVLWYSFYLKPNVLEYLSGANKISQKITEKKYNDVDDLKKELNTFDINYEIKNLEDEVIATKKVKSTNYLFMYDLVKVSDTSYFVKGYLTNKFASTKIITTFINIQLILLFIVIMFIYLITNRSFINPIEKIISDIKNYKYGKKPLKTKVRSEIDVVQNEFVKLTEELDKTDADKNRIIASISHDIKTPLTSIIGYSDLIKEEENLEEIKKYNETINVKANNIREIVYNFDEYLINNSSDTLTFDEVLIKDLIDLLKSDYQAELEMNNIEFIINSNCSKEKVNINLQKMKRVFQNLISNSVRFLKSNGYIKIEITEVKKNIVFKISDNGTGVPKDKIDMIFEPLYTSDKSRKISGLGLSICKEIIIYHGGKITAYNNKDNGLTVEFSIPKK